ncbi:protocadherin-10-like [Pristis pectinata]|uniref:protocadherin-10-like n=1 Tax=Pristis pectinata TaxID=685728 RepID=UPI00223D3BAB|nr:protocadherin-10-like [Pristis pectinata]
MENLLNCGTSFALLVCMSAIVSAQLHYSIPEEMELGAFVGNIAEDLRLNVWELSTRRFRVVSDQSKQYLEVNVDDGNLFVNERIDREQLCMQSLICSLSLQIALYNPEEMHGITVEILDINDNSPSFQKSEYYLHIGEQIALGARFPFESAHDPDIGTNTINTYQITPNEHFGIKVQTRRGGSKTAELVLEKPLDREQQETFQIMVTAVDGGTPRRSGTARIIITVLDANDNAPVFDHESYSATLPENAMRGTLVTKINAVDVDEGSNAELTYSFTDHVPQTLRELFRLDPKTGQIIVEGPLNFEKSVFYELDVEAIDNGSPALTGHSKVIITVTDVNDNAPVIHVISSSRTVPENAQPGTAVATISIMDLDSGENGQVNCQIAREFPFTLQKSSSNDYKLVINDILDRERTTMYNISISAWDGGSPPLSTQASVLISVSDINDNAPRFTQTSYNVYLMENNTPGSSIFAVSATDSDIGQNGDIVYTVLGNMVDADSESRYVTINSKNGNIYALTSFDYEVLKHFHFKVQAQDSGRPTLSSTATVSVIILDQNDNTPIIISPLMVNGSASVEILPQSIQPGYLVTKIIATDADSGQNSRLSYLLSERTDHSLFTVGVLTGEIRATRRFRDQDLVTDRIVLCVKDNGQPSLSTIATVFFLILPNSTTPSFESSVEPNDRKQPLNLNLYLIIALGSTSFLFLVTIFVLVVVKVKQDRHIDERYSSCFCCSDRRNSSIIYNQRHAAKDDTNYIDSGQTESYRYTVCLSPESSKSDFLFLKPCHPTLPFNDVGALENSARR